MSKIILLDTCFLLELLAVPVDSTPEKHQAAVELLSFAVDNSYDLYCPLGVLYELANHIVDIKNREEQIRVANLFSEMVVMAWENQSPFAIIPGADSSDFLEDLASLPDLCEKYQASIRQRLSLVDCTIIDVAISVKSNYAGRKKKWPAHIWTCHGELKAMEPDRFEHAFF